MLTAEQRQQFDERGYVHIKGAFSRSAAEAMQALVWDTLAEKFGIQKDDSATWSKTDVFKLQALKERPEFKAIGSEITLGVIDDLLGKDSWKRPKDWGQFLVTFPEHTEWTVPEDWHIDFSYSPYTEPLIGLLMFSFFGDVAPQSGGTAVVCGSHRIIAQFIESQPNLLRQKKKNCRIALLKSDPWLVNLSSEESDGDRIATFMDTDHLINNIPVRVAELTGEAGDIVIGHPLLLHTKALNCGKCPRFMLVQRITALNP